MLDAADQGGSPARRRAARRPAGVGERDDRAGQLERRQRAAADAGDRLDHELGAGDQRGEPRRARARRRRGASPAPGSRPARRGAARSVASSAASESLSIRRARASGCSRAASTASARPTSSPACGPPSSLSPEKHDQRRAGRDRAAHRRLVVELGPARPSRRRRSPARRARTAPRSARPRRTRAGGSSTGARAGSRRCPP